jgi:hypothetical protein
MRDAEQTGEEVDVLTRPEAEVDEGRSGAQAAPAGAGQLVMETIHHGQGQRPE